MQRENLEHFSITKSFNYFSFLSPPLTAFSPTCSLQLLLHMPSSLPIAINSLTPPAPNSWILPSQTSPALLLQFLPLIFSSDFFCFRSFMLLLKEKHVLVLHETIQGSDFPSPLPLLPPPPPPPLSINNYENKISPSILLIIVILAVIFFISGVLHLLVRFLLRPTARDPESPDNATALQGQLQELFHLHDAGVDQSFIDTLPVFQYKAIIGLKDPFDCAVCLCEFEPEDKLRLLPKCSHAFHIECIDTWLLSHSTCPLCRRSLFSDFSSPVNNSCSPIVLLLESGSESSREILASNREEAGQNPLLGFAGEAGEAVADEKVVPVKLGKFKNVDVGGGGGGEGSSISCNGNLEQSQRRCFSMGSYEYVMDQSCMLQVAVKPVKKKLSIKRPGHRAVMSECDCHSKREGFKVLDESKSSELRVDDSCAGTASATSLQRRESFSVSKIWLRPKAQKTVGGDSSRRAFSFRLPLQEELDLGERKEKGESEEDFDVEVGSCVTSFGSQIEETPSFARRTLLWIVGRQSKVGSDHQSVLN